MTIRDLQADAYQKIAALVRTPAYQSYAEHSTKGSCAACELQRIVDETELAQDAFKHTVEDHIFELARTRLARLPRAQFIWCAMTSVPQIERKGVRSYLMSHTSVFDVPRKGTFDAVAKIEEDLWSKSNCETKVFWNGWTISELSDTHFRISTHWSAAYIHEGEVYTGPSEFEEPLIQTKAYKRFASWGENVSQQGVDRD